jgi:ribonuclease J
MNFMNKLSDWIKKSGDDIAPVNKKKASIFKDKPKKQQGQKKKYQGQQGKQQGQKKKYQGQNRHRQPQKQNNRPKEKTVSKYASSKNKLRIIPIGGLDEVGKNCTCIEYGRDIVVVDMGMQFPEEDMYGVDYLIPDITYLENRKQQIRGIIITHGHMDHIGALRHVLPKLNFPPVYATRMTHGIVEKTLSEFKLGSKVTLKSVDESSIIKLGCFEANFFQVNHSIPDSVGVILKTPVGNVVHSGDFKFDYNPDIGEPANFSKIAQAGGSGVVAALVESTNATNSEPTISDKTVADSLESLVRDTKGRLIIASFSSVIGRIGQIMQLANKTDRKVFMSGRSMIQNTEIAEKLGYLHIPKDTLRQINSINSLPPQKILILTTGSQGEEMSALSRMSLGTHHQIQIKPGDTIILSSSPIPGNERSIATIRNNLIRLGAKIITNNDMDVHTSGHGNQNDLRLMYSLLKPKYLVPIHGELHMRHAHKDLIENLGMDERNIPILENGDILEIDHQGRARKSKSKVPANMITVEGTSSGVSGREIQNERQIMANNGALICLFRVYQHNGNLIADPSITSRGFIYMEDSKKILNDAVQVAKKAYVDWQESDKKSDVKELIRRSLCRFMQKKIHKQPLVVPVIVKQ